jgi:hypothetical protein
VKISLGNFGFQGPAPVQHSALGMGGATAESDAMQRLGAVGQHAAAGLIGDQRQEDEALARARAGNALLDHEDKVRTLADDITQRLADGSLRHESAQEAYKSAMQLLDKPAVEGLSAAMMETFDKGMKRAEMSGFAAIRSAGEKAKRADFRAQIDGAFDRLGKLAGRPGADMAAISAQADSLDDLGRGAFGDGWEKKKQDWRDASFDAHLNQKALAVRDDLKGIVALQKQVSDGEFADKLDSNRRNALVARLDGYRTSIIQRSEAAANRAHREEERRLKKAEAEFNTFQALSDKGTALSPEYVDTAIAATAGTPYQKGISTIAKQARENGGIAAQPIRTQQAMLDEIDARIAKEGRSPELDKRREQVSKVLKGSRADLKENGLRAGLERGVITEIAPIDISTPEALAGSIAKRLEQSEVVRLWAGKPVSPLDAQEAEKLSGMLETLSPKLRSQAVATISQAAGPRASAAIAEQIDHRDRPLALAFAHAGDQTTAGRYTSELIHKGAGALRDGLVMKDDKKVSGWKATIATAVDGAFLNEKAAQAVKDSAYYIAAGIAAESGGSVSASELKRAVRLASGGDIIERMGKKLPIPAGMSEGDFEDRLRAVSAGDIEKQAPGGKVRVGGVEMPAAEFAASIPGQELVASGVGRYAVIVRGRPVVNMSGAPIIIGVK